MPGSDNDFLHAAEEAVGRLEASHAWRDLIPAVERPIVEPAITPKKGHIALQVTGGLLGTNLVRSADQTPLLIKGNVRKASGPAACDELDSGWFMTRCPWDGRSSNGLARGIPIAATRMVVVNQWIGDRARGTRTDRPGQKRLI